MVEKLSTLREAKGSGIAKEVKPFLTAPMVWAEILRGHSKVLQTEIAFYPHHFHGERPGDYYCEFVPIDYLDSTLSQGNWPRRSFLVDEVVAVWAVVDVCNEGSCSHNYKDHQNKSLQIWNYWHDGLSFPWGESLSFIFLDIEWYGSAALAKVLEVLRGASVDWHLLDSGGGYHVIFEELVALTDLPRRYGEIISLFGNRLRNFKLEGWGDDLVRNGNNQRKVLSWCEDVLENCGHVDEPIGRETHIIDLRHVAHGLQRVIDYRSWLDENPTLSLRLKNSLTLRLRTGGGPYLRISSTKDYSIPPILVAKQSSGEVARLVSEEEPLFQRLAIQRALL